MRREDIKGLQQVGLQIVNVCDGRCIMCEKRLGKSEKRTHMSVPQIRQLVQEIKTLGIKAVTGVCGLAEAHFHPELDSALAAVSEIPWCFGSNCHALSADKSEIVVRHKPVGVSLSIDAVTDDVLKTMRPTMDLDRVRENARYFIDHVRSKPAWPNRNIYLQMVVTKLNAHQVDAFIDEWLPFIEGIPGVGVHIKPCFAWPRIPAAEIEQFYPSPAVDLEGRKHPQLRVDNFGVAARLRPSCSLFWKFALVKADGTYLPCCMCGDDLWGVGNVFETSLLECYNSPRMKELRALMLAKKYDQVPLCKDCK